MAIARALPFKARSAITLGLILSLFASGLVALQHAAAQTSGTPLLAIGVDVVSASIAKATYRVNVRNEGSGDAANVRVSIPVPEATGFETTFDSSEPDASPVEGSAPGAAPTCDDGGAPELKNTSCQWAFGVLPPRANVTIDVTFNLLAPTSDNPVRLDVTATVTGKDPSTDATLSTSNMDESLTRKRVTISNDTYVDSSKPAGTNYGGCASLTVDGGTTRTAYVDAADGDLNISTVEDVWAAELLMNVLTSGYSDAAPGSLALFPIQSSWTEGSGDCSGGIGSGDQARTGQPIATGAQSTVAPVKASGSTVRWDVTNDLDGGAERAAFLGWQIRNLSTTGTVNLHSKESTNDALDPKIVMVYTQTEASRCIDVDPESKVGAPTSEQLLTALVTDGPPGSKLSAGGRDACNGTPVPGVLVTWQIDDDGPDVYISNQAGTQVPKAGTSADATPNDRTTSTDSAGTTFIGVRLGNTLNWTGGNRVAGCTNTCGLAEPESCTDTNRDLGICTPPPGEDQNEDDVAIAWSPNATPEPEYTSTPTPGPPTISGFSPTAGPIGTSVTVDGSNFTGASAVRFNGVPAQFTVNSPTRITTTVPSGASDGPISVQNPSGTTVSPGNFDVTPGTASPSASPTNSPPFTASPGSTVSPGGLSPVQLNLTSSAEKSLAFSEVTLSGVLASDNPLCEQPGATVEILKREAETTTFEHLAYATTGVGGLFEHKVAPEASTVYSARIGEHTPCAEASATEVTVLVKPVVSIKSTVSSVERGRRFWITGSVLPKHQLTAVKIFRKIGPGQWEKLGKDFLDASSRYSFAIKYTWRRKATVFVVRWKATDADHISSASPRLRIKRAITDG